MTSGYTESRGFLMSAVLPSGDVAVARSTLCMLKGATRAKTALWVDRWRGAVPPDDLVVGKVPMLRAACGKGTTMAWPPKHGVAAQPIEVSP